MLTHCLTIWNPGCTAKDRKALQGVIKSAQCIIGCPLTSLEDTANTRRLNRAQKILSDPSHPGNGLFNLLPSGKRYRVLGSRTKALKKVNWVMKKEDYLQVLQDPKPSAEDSGLGCSWVFQQDNDPNTHEKWWRNGSVRLLLRFWNGLPKVLTWSPTRMWTVDEGSQSSR